jgi:hypothetical protein
MGGKTLDDAALGEIQEVDIPSSLTSRVGANNWLQWRRFYGSVTDNKRASFTGTFSFSPFLKILVNMTGRSF